MKKQIRMLADIAAVAAVTLVLAVAMLPAGLSGAGELTDEVAGEPPANVSDDGLTADSTSDTTTTEPEQPPQTSGTTTEETTTTESEATSAPQVTTTSPPRTSTTQATAVPQPTWTERETSGVKYVNTDGISSVEVAQIGSKKIKQYSLNDAVTVVALTDTDYYKLADGTFIHADFLSDSETVITAAEQSEQTEPPVSETEEETETETEAETETETEPESEEDTEAETDADVVLLSARSDTQSKALEMYDMVNEYRAQYGLPALQWDYSAYPAAQIRANELLQRNSHTRPNGSSYSTVFGEVGYSPSASGENIVYYYSDPRPALNSLISSASHRDLILSSKFTHISIAYVYDPNSYWGYYWVQELTTP